MSNKGYQVHVPITTYPGSDNYYVICDVCGFKYRKKDTTQVQDRFNLQNRLIVCRQDLDKVNDQSRPFKAREYKAPKLVRPEPDQQHYPEVPNPRGSMAPGQVTNLIAFADPLTEAIDLWWLGPIDGGDGPVTGYVIYQAIPQLSNPIIINANTLNGSPFYQDTITPVDAQCTYQVAAINEYGAGPLSAIAFYPIIKVRQSVQYFTGYSPNYPTLGETVTGPYFVGYSND